MFVIRVYRLTDHQFRMDALPARGHASNDPAINKIGISDYFTPSLLCNSSMTVASWLKTRLKGDQSTYGGPACSDSILSL